MTNDEKIEELVTQSFVIRALSFLRHSSFELRHSFIIRTSAR